MLIAIKNHAQGNPEHLQCLCIKIILFKSRLDHYENQTVMYFDEQGVLKCRLATMDDYVIGNDKVSAKLKFRVGGFNPFDVYKAFLKVAISLMPDEFLSKEKWIFD